MPAPLLRAAGPLEDEFGLHLIPLSVFLLEALGPTYIGWTSEALRSELTERFGEIGVLTWERIQALRLLHTNDSFWQEWEVFEKVTAVLLGELAVFSLAQPPEAAEIAIALDVARRIDTHEFSPDVGGYICAAALTDGLWFFEEPLATVAGPALSEHDSRQGINRSFGAVAEALQKSTEFRADPDDHVSAQVNRVLEVRVAVRRYNEAVARQLDQISDLLKEKR